MANPFDFVNQPLSSGPGSWQNYDVGASEAASTAMSTDFENNPLGAVARMGRRYVEDNAYLFGKTPDMVSAEAAREEVKSRNLDLTIPDEGISRYELDTMQYLKQRELNQQFISSRTKSFSANAAALAGSFAAGAVDPINIASSFIPIVPELKAAQWLGAAGTNMFERAAVRAGIGAAEGAVGAAMIEPLNYISAQEEQRTYTAADSFTNILFGGILGAGLHTIGGGVYDWRMGRALTSLDRGLNALDTREALASASDQSQLDTLRAYTEALENDDIPPPADEILAKGIKPEVMDEVRRGVDESQSVAPVPEPTRVETGEPLPRGLTELIPEAEQDRSAEAFNRQFSDKDQTDIEGFGPTQIRPPKEDIFEVGAAQWPGDITHKAKMVPIDELSGGVSRDPRETARVEDLKAMIKGPAGYIERLIVDADGNVIEGQHRLEALRQLGVKEVPVIEIKPVSKGLPTTDMADAIRSTGPIRSEHVQQIIDMVARAIDDVGSVDEVRAQYEAPKGFGRQWGAALDAVEARERFQADAEPTKTDTPEFKRWFGDSKVVDADGNPLVVYHGGTFDELKDGVFKNGRSFGFFFTPDRKKAQSYAPGVGKYVPVTEAYLSLQNPFMPTNDAHVRAPWVKQWINFWRENGGWVDRRTGEKMEDYEVFQMIEDTRLYEYEENGMNISERWDDFLRTAQEHHDGFFGYDPTDGAVIAAAFEPTQIKSAIGNIGTFDPKNPHIRYQSDIVDEDAAAQQAAQSAYNQQRGEGYDKSYQSPYGARAKTGELSDRRGIRGSESVLPSSGARGDATPLIDAPTTAKVPGVGTVDVGPFPTARRIAREYVESTGRAYRPIDTYRKVDPERAKRIAQAFEEMRHDPEDPEVKAAYTAMIKETMDQWDAIKKSGLKVEFIDISKGDPYAASPRLAIQDVKENNHLWVFSTDDGFGTDGITAHDASDNPLFAIVPGETISGKPVRANDIFRIVHDYFGHIKDGSGFRADGEENAWRSHLTMYSHEAGRAMTTETRGQNSWLNYGPHGETNRNAKLEDTVFAEQKIGLLPDWVMREGLADDPETIRRATVHSIPEITQDAIDIAREYSGDVEPERFQAQDEHAQTDTPAFKRFFRKSKVVDKDGEPLVVWHHGGFDEQSDIPNGYMHFGTRTAAIDRALGKRVDDEMVAIDVYQDDEGNWHWQDSSGSTSEDLGLPGYASADTAKRFGQDIVKNEIEETDFDFDELGTMTGAYLSLQNPKRVEDQGANWDAAIAQAKKEGFDGIVYTNRYEDKGSTSYIAFEPTQIKSVKNRGTFDATNPDIKFQSTMADEEMSRFQNEIDEKNDLIAVHNLTADNLLHSQKLGGIPAPSVAVIKGSHGLEGFGEISLIAPKNLVDPRSGAQAFGADVYSPRYPDVEYQVPYKSIEKLRKEFQKASKDLGNALSSELGEDDIQRKGSGAIRESVAAMLTYARERKIKVPELDEFDEADWKRRVDEAYRKIKDVADDDDAYRQAYRELSAIQREPDRINQDQKYKIRNQFSSDPDFQHWADEKFAELKAKERIFKGFSDTTGDRKYTPHNLENVVKEMRKNIRGGENFNYGAGSLRAHITPQFKSIAEIKKHSGKIVTRADFDAIKKEVDNELIALGERIVPHTKYDKNNFRALDDFINTMQDAAKTRNLRRTFDEHYTNLSNDDLKAIGDFMQKLRDLPTSYFEVKLPRAVGINEFTGAVVPDNVSAKALEVLKKNGITNIVTYPKGDEAARTAAINNFRDEMFQADLGGSMLGFYSQVQRTLEGADMKKASGTEWLGWLKNRPGVKGEELEYTGLADFLTEHGDDQLTREEVLQHAKDHAVQLEQVTYGYDTKDTIRPDEQSYLKFKSEWDAINKRISDLEVERTNERYGGDSVKADAIDREQTLAQQQRELIHNKMVEDTISRTGVDVQRPKFERYTLPGGDNYKELLLKIPTFNETLTHLPKASEIEVRKVHYEPSNTYHWETFDKRTGDLISRHPISITEDEAVQQALGDLRKRASNQPDKDFSSLHFSQKNIIAHARISDRVTTSGKKALHMEEAQSDWHQKGRKKGYKPRKPIEENFDEFELRRNKVIARLLELGPEFNAINERVARQAGYKNKEDALHNPAPGKSLLAILKQDAEWVSLTNEQKQLMNERQELDEKIKPKPKQYLVPDAPFKKSWHELMLKRLIRYAAENGYDEIVWTPGHIQAERFDLSHEVDELVWFPGKDGSKGDIQGIKDKREVFYQDNVEASKLDDIIGKDVADRLINNPSEKTPGKNGFNHTLRGDGLKAGGAGMKGFYDKIIPEFLNKYGKKYGAKVGTDDIAIGNPENADNDFAIRDNLVYEGNGMVHEFETNAEARAFVDAKVGAKETLHSFPITPELKAAVMEGQPLFQKDAGAPVTHVETTKLNTEELQRSERLREEIHNLVQKMTGERYDTQFYSKMKAYKDGRRLKVTGGIDFLRKIITFTMESADLKGTAKHEVIHALRDADLLSDGEWATLVQAAVDGRWLDKKYGTDHTIRERYKNLSLEQQIEEAIAEQFGMGHVEMFKGYPEPVRKIMMRLKEFFDGVGEIVRKIFGQYSTATDIMRQIERGEIGQRGLDLPEPKAREGGLSALQGEEAPEKPSIGIDRWAADDAAISAQANQDQQNAKEETIADIEAQTALLGAHLQSMRERGLLSEADEETLRLGDEEAEVMEHEAAAYEAAGICEGEGE